LSNPEPATTSSARAAEVRIGLWGAPFSGKTTFLSALRVASFGSASGSWRIRPDDEHSSQFLTEATNTLQRRHAFPPATHVVGKPYVWHIDGCPGGSMFDQVMEFVANGGRRVAFRLEVLDCPGRIFDDASGHDTDGLPAVLNHMVQSDGLLYLFDPTRPGDSYSYFQRMLDRLLIESDRSGRLTPDGLLRHSLAVCITKLDDGHVLEGARSRGLVTMEPDGTPFLDPEQARHWFESLVEGADEMVLQSIEQTFDPSNVRYFATSAVGFRRWPDGAVHLDDCANVYVVDGDHRISGEVRPINVLEPLVWVERAARYRRRR
jgi:hypothetical protein